MALRRNCEKCRHPETWLLQLVCVLVACGVLLDARSMTVELRSYEKLQVTCDADPPQVVITPSASILGTYSKWAVSTDAAPCARVPRRIYKKGGRTVDAAIATLLCMGVVLPHSMGIGGGFIATVYSGATKEVKVLIARETAPQHASRDMFVHKTQERRWGGLAAAVPGELRGYKALHDYLNSSLNWTDLFEDAIRLAEHGFAVGPHLAQALVLGLGINTTLANKTKEAFMNDETGELLAEGEILVQRDVAKTLQDVANRGVEYFYNGTLGEQIVQEIRDNGGIMMEEDLANYTVQWVDPIKSTFRDGRTIFSAPPPGSGPVLVYILGIMDQFRSYEGARLDDDVLTLHRFAEACKFAYAKRALLGDPSFVDCSELVLNMTSSMLAKGASARINDSHTFADPRYYGFVNSSHKLDKGTAHATFWGPDGDIIAVTSSINDYFGSLVRTSSGVLLNNQMDDFSTPSQSDIYDVAPSEANFIEPGKRPMSSMAPAIVFDSCGKAKLALGGTGGPRATTGVAQVTMRTLWQGNNIKEAIDYPRLHHQLIPNELNVESFFPKTYVQALRKRGHNVTYPCGTFSVFMGVQERSGLIYANSDFRKGGSVDGQ